MELVNFTLDVLKATGALGALVLFAWLWMSGRIISRGEFDRMVLRYEDDLKEERKEKGEWKFVALRGTELAKYLGEKVTTP